MYVFFDWANASIGKKILTSWMKKAVFKRCLVKLNFFIEIDLIGVMIFASDK